MDTNLGPSIFLTESKIPLNSFIKVLVLYYFSWDTITNRHLFEWVTVTTEGPGYWDGGSILHEVSLIIICMHTNPHLLEAILKYFSDDSVGIPSVT